MITLKVNGIEYEIPEEKDKRLLDFLRDDLRLTAAKEGCGAGACSGCDGTGCSRGRRTRGGAGTARHIGAGRRGLGKFLVIWGFAPVHKALLAIKIIAN